MKVKLTVTLLIAALIASLIGCAVLAYLWIDRSITLSYTNQSMETSRASIRRFEYLLTSEWGGMPESVVLQKLQAEVARFPEEKIVLKKEGDIIWFDQIRFNFEQGRLKKIGDS